MLHISSANILVLTNHAFHNVLPQALRCTERLIHTHLLDLLDREMEFLSLFDHKENLQFFGQHLEFPSLMDTVSTLLCAERTARKYRIDGHTNGNGGNVRSPKRSTSHQRILSEPPIFHNTTTMEGLLNIDDPLEEEGSTSDGWYFGRSSPPPPKSMVTTSNNTVEDSILNHDIHIPKHIGTPPRHRRTFSHGAVDSPPTTTLSPNAMYPSRSAKDSSLFRLIVTLQLCLVRIEEANSVLCRGQAVPMAGEGNTADGEMDLNLIRTCTSSNSFDCDSTSSMGHGLGNKILESPRWRTSRMLTICLGLGLTYYSSSERIKEMTVSERIQLMKSAGKISVGFFMARSIRNRWRILCMNARVSNSAEAIQDWIFSWICLVNENSAGTDKQLFMPEKVSILFSLVCEQTYSSL